MSDIDDPAVHRALVALLLAVLDGDCEQRVHELLCRDDDPHFAMHVAHRFAHNVAGSDDDPAEEAEFRAGVIAELHQLAAGD